MYTLNHQGTNLDFHGIQHATANQRALDKAHADVIGPAIAENVGKPPSIP